MVSPDMVSVLLDHHADPNARTLDGVTPLDVLRSRTSEFIFKGALPGLTHIEPNKFRLCLEPVQSAVMVHIRLSVALSSHSNLSREAGPGKLFFSLASSSAPLLPGAASVLPHPAGSARGRSRSGDERFVPGSKGLDAKEHATLAAM